MAWWMGIYLFPYFPRRVIVETMDLISLAIFVGSAATRLLSLGLQPVFYEPSAWKGSVPKDVMIERIKRRLSPEEHARVDLPRAKSLHHNIWDAVGIGLYHLKRRS
jgi:hypothetical protein